MLKGYIVRERLGTPILKFQTTTGTLNLAGTGDWTLNRPEPGQSKIFLGLVIWEKTRVL